MKLSQNQQQIKKLCPINQYTHGFTTNGVKDGVKKIMIYQWLMKLNAATQKTVDYMRVC